MEQHYLEIAKECQALARKYAPAQNLAGELGPPNPLARFFRWLVRRPYKRLTSRDMTRIVSALLSAGNMLEYEASKNGAPAQNPYA